LKGGNVLILTRRPTESLVIGDDVTVTVLEIKGSQVRIGVNAPRKVAAHRKEIFEKLRAERAAEARSHDGKGAVQRATRHTPNGPASGLMSDIAMGLLRLAWTIIRLPILTFFVILQPVVGLVFGGLALLGVLTSFFFKLSGAAPHFPFLVMLAISIGFGLFVLGYEALIRYVSQ
jgi:carbon storage regulator